jgi:hypothetical protein
MRIEEFFADSESRDANMDGNLKTCCPEMPGTGLNSGRFNNVIYEASVKIIKGLA